jgi:hypothetical protein
MVVTRLWVVDTQLQVPHPSLHALGFANIKESTLNHAEQLLSPATPAVAAVASVKA